MRGSYLNDPCRELRTGEPDDESQATEPSLAAQDRAEDLLCEFVADHPPTAHVIALARELERFAAEYMDAAKVYAAPPWLSDVAEALGMVRPCDGAPLALNWTQVLAAIRDLRNERDDWKANSESWRMAYNAWQDWAKDLLDEFGRQPLHGSHGDGPAREVISQLVSMAPGVPRCLECGCFSTVHKVDDEELRGCTDCACKQFEAPNG